VSQKRVGGRAGLDLLCDGVLRWQDLFRPLAEGSRINHNIREILDVQTEER